MGRRNRKQELSIRQSANISSEMRKEIQNQGECFETTSSSAPSLSSPTVTSDSTGSLRTRSTSATSKKSEKSKTQIRVLSEDVHSYDNELVSVYERSSNTASMDSLEEFPNDKAFEEYEKNCQPSTRMPEPVVPLKIVKFQMGQPEIREFLTDFECCKAIDGGNPHPQAKRVEIRKRFETELVFCDNLIKDIERIVMTSRRTDLELKIVKSRDKNMMPRCQIQLIRKMYKPEVHKDPPGLYGFAPPEIYLPKKSEDNSNFAENPSGKSRISRVLSLPFKTISNGTSHVMNIFGRWKGNKN